MISDLLSSRKMPKENIFAAKQNSSFRNLPDLVSLFFLLTISRPPWGYVKTKKLLHTLENPHSKKSPGTSPDPESGAGDLRSRTLHVDLHAELHHVENRRPADSAP